MQRHRPCALQDGLQPDADDVTAEYGSEITLPAVPTKTGYTGEWQIGGKAVETDYKVTEDVTVTAVYTHVKVSVCYVGGYSDGGNNDPTNFRLSNSTTGTLDYDMTAEELQSEIATWKESVDSYTAVKVVYDNTETSLSDLDNPLDIDSLPEITADTKVSDIVNDYEYDGVYRLFVRIYLVPAWENVYKVTFHDVDGEEIESHCSMGELLNDIPAATENYTWVYTNGNNSTEEFTQDTWIEFDTDVYCGCKITVYEYTEGAWESTGSFAKKIGEPLKESDLWRFSEFYDYINSNYYVIAGFAAQAISGVTQENIDLVTFSAGQTFDRNIDLYIVKASIEYTKLDGTTGTLYWSGEGSLIEQLNSLRSSTNYSWHFDNEVGDIVSEETLDKCLHFDEVPDNSQTGARLKVFETE